MKQLFSVFSKNGVEFKLEEDFNLKEEFAAVLKATWIDGMLFLSLYFVIIISDSLFVYFLLERKVDPTFGCAPNKGVYDETSDRRIREVVIDKTIDLVHDYQALSYYCCFIFLRYFGVRGGEEVAFLEWNQVQFLVYSQGPFQGMNYVLLNIEFDKGTCLFV